MRFVLALIRVAEGLLNTGQLLSVVDFRRAQRLGLQERDEDSDALFRYLERNTARSARVTLLTVTEQLPTDLALAPETPRQWRARAESYLDELIQKLQPHNFAIDVQILDGGRRTWTARPRLRPHRRPGRTLPIGQGIWTKNS